MSFDWKAIGAEFRKCVGGEKSLTLDHARIETLAREIAAGRLSADSNIVSGSVRLAEPDDVPALEDLPAAERATLVALGAEAIAQGRVAVAVLNGGMATRFGGEVKGIVEAIGGRTFLEIKLAQARSTAPVPFLLMNSFATHERTLAFLSRQGLEADAFLQDASLRLTPQGEIFRDADGGISPYAPGHGDFPDALRRSGLLARLARDGVEMITLSNIDNLGADLDPLVIGYHLREGRLLTAEVARTRPGDAGGAPAFVDGRLQVVEGFRYPKDLDVSALAFLATNSFVFSLPVLEREYPLSWFYVEKDVDGRRAVQMERLVNELSSFEDTTFVAVPRDGPRGRFFPIKTREDLEALQGDAELAQRFGLPANKRL